ncbi:Pyridoxine 4-dehydrogenase [Ascosphaera aggregata]|nr:Pyridoxine 4-dehydrogenase [Ascosphaera aggregata]
MPLLSGREVGHTGYGLMRPEEYTTPMETALVRGSNFWNAGELYGTPKHNSLHLLRDYFKAHPEDAKKVVLSIKGSMVPGTFTPDNSKENLDRSINECLTVLEGTKEIDIFEPARIDSVHPIEETIEHLAGYVKDGKIKGIGLSHVDAETIRRAVHPIAAVEVMLNIGDRSILKNGVTSVCSELGIPIVAYSPLGCGFLTGRIKSMADIPAGDVRHHVTSDEQLKIGETFVRTIESFAKKKGLTPAQLSLTWVRTLSTQEDMPTIIPIPGSTNTFRVIENTTDTPLFTVEEINEINNLLDDTERKGVVTALNDVSREAQKA